MALSRYHWLIQTSTLNKRKELTDKKLVQKSLAITELNEAKELLQELEIIFENQTKLAQIKATIPKEVLEQMLQEELLKAKVTLKSFG